ncbi:camphor resistance CrcB protein 1 [candidate division TM7 genomosp. GTL1]|nr:camphor resistance CrcB protein 1 [candidate division TM7 genomosp. GTL1]
MTHFTTIGMFFIAYEETIQYMKRFKRRFYDSHPYLPLDPDPDQLKVVWPIHADWAHITVVGAGAFFGTLLRYEIGLWIPNGVNGWSAATLFVNVVGAFLLGLLLQGLLHYGKDEGGRRVLRLALGTGFMGAFTTYSSLAVSIAVLTRGNEIDQAALYACVSIGLGIMACAFGIWLATAYHNRRNGGRNA